MIIKKLSGHTPSITEEYLQKYPQDFISEKEKQTPRWIKMTMDYFTNIALGQYRKKGKKFTPNYEIVNNILKPYHFYDSKEVADFLDTNAEKDILPNHVKHYSIISAPLNEMCGEQARRPDTAFVTDTSSEARSSKLEFRLNLLKEYFTQQVQSQIYQQLSQQELSEEEFQQSFQQLSEERLKELSHSYTTIAEKWGARMLEELKLNLSLKEKSETAFRDYLTTAEEFFHIYEDNSPLGFNVEAVNPRNEWDLKTPNQKYISDPLDPTAGAYAAGTVEIMEISEILHKFNLNEQEVKHLYQWQKDSDGSPTEVSNLYRSGTGENTIRYETYDRLTLQERIKNEALADEYSEMEDWLGISPSISTFGNKFVVVRAYWCSKKKIGKLTFVNDDNVPETTYVDENYHSGDHPTELDIEWAWENQWYQGIKIGPDIYFVKPFELLPYCPIIGVRNTRNSPATSFVDMSKPYQMLFNVFFNKAFEQMQKDSGMVELWNTRTIPTPKDGDPEDAISNFERVIEERGKAYIDDSPDNTKGPSQFNQYTAINASRAQHIAEYFNIAQNIKLQYQELLGFSPQRLAKVQATETATATNAALSQSYAQTEPYFTQHEYILNKLYQALLDAAQYITISRPDSIISNNLSDEEDIFLQTNPLDLTLAKLKVFVSSRGEEAQGFKFLQSLAQSMIQNGVSAYELSSIVFSKSSAKIKEVLKSAQDKVDAMQQQQMDIEQQQIQQQQQQFQAMQELEAAKEQRSYEFQAWQNELDRLSAERQSIIAQMGKAQAPLPDISSDGVEVSRLQMDQQKSLQEYNLRLREIQSKEAEIAQKIQLERDKIKKDYANQANDLAISKVQAAAKKKQSKK